MHSSGLGSGPAPCCPERGQDGLSTLAGSASLHRQDVRRPTRPAAPPRGTLPRPRLRSEAVGWRSFDLLSSCLDHAAAAAVSVPPGCSPAPVNQRNALPSRHIVWSTVASCRPTDTTTFLCPRRLATLIPKARRLDNCLQRTSSARGRVEQRTHLGMTGSRDAARVVDRARLEALGCEDEVRADRSRTAEARWIIDGRLERQRRHRANAGHRHEPPAYFITADHPHDLLVQSTIFLEQRSADAEQRLHQRAQGRRRARGCVPRDARGCPRRSPGRTPSERRATRSRRRGTCASTDVDRKAESTVKGTPGFLL